MTVPSLLSPRPWMPLQISLWSYGHRAENRAAWPRARPDHHADTVPGRDGLTTLTATPGGYSLGSAPPSSRLRSSASSLPSRTNCVGTKRGVRRMNGKMRGHTYKSSIRRSPSAPAGQFNNSSIRDACFSRNARRRAIFANCPESGVLPKTSSRRRRVSLMQNGGLLYLHSTMNHRLSSGR